MANIELNIVALGDFTSVNDSITKLKAQIASLNASLAGATGASFDKAALSVKSLSNEFSNALTSSNAFTKQTVQLQTETEKFGQSLQNGTLGLGNYYQILAKKQGDTMNSVKALAVEQTKLQNSVIMADPSKQGFYSVFTPKSIDAVANATKIAANEQNIYNTAIKAGSAELINWGKNTQWAGRQLTVGMAMPLLVFGQQAVSAFDSVNKALTQLQKVYGEGLTPPSQNSIDQISKQVLDLGRNMAATLGISQQFTVEVATSFAAMGKMGGDLTSATEQTVRLAKLGNLDQQTATQAVIALQNVYKLSATQLGDAVNYFGAIQKQTSLSMTDLVTAESKVGPIIDQLGGSYKDTSIMLLAMKEAGVPAAQAANALKSAFGSIIAPTSAANKEFAAYGINLNAIKTAGGPVQMIEKLQTALQNLSPLVREQLIEKLFGKYQFSRISALLDNFGKVGSQTANAIQVANASSSQLAGLANQEIAQATKSPSAQWQIALQTFKADLYPLGQDIIKIGTKVLEFGNHISKIFSGLPGPIKLFVGLLLGLTVIAGPVIMLTGLMANFVGNILKGVINLKDLITGGKSMRQLFTPELIAAQNATGLFADGLKGDVDQVKLLTQAISDLTDKLGLMKDQLNVGAGIDDLKSAVGATAQVEASIFSQMALPGFADGGIIRGPGTGTSDSILARVSNGETILTAEQTKKNSGVISDIILGNHIPGYNDGVVGLNNDPVEAHTKLNFGPGTPQYENYLKQNPGIINPETSLKLTSDQTATLPSWLNLRLRAPKKIKPSSGVSKEDFSTGWDQMGSSQFVNTASRHGISASDMEDEKVRKALKDFADGVKSRVLSLDKSRVLDEDLSKATQDQIDAMKNGTEQERKVAAAIEEAGNTIGQARVNIGTAAARAGVKSGQYSITNAEGTFTGAEAEGKTGIVRTSEGTAVARISSRSSGGTRVADVKDDTVSSGNWINPKVSAQVAQKAYSQLESNLADSLNQASQSHSPSEETKKAATNMVDGVIEGVKEGKAKVAEAVQDELPLSSWQTPDLTPQVGPRMANGGFYSGDVAPGISSNSADAAAADAEVTGKLTRVKQSILGKMQKEEGGLKASAKGGMGMALMMGGSMVANALPKGSVAQSAMSNVASYAGMGMMAGPEGAAVGAAVGLAITGVQQLIKVEKDHAAQAASVFGVSSDAVKAYGGQIQTAAGYAQTLLTSIQNTPNSKTITLNVVQGMAFDSNNVEQYTSKDISTARTDLEAGKSTNGLDPDLYKKLKGEDDKSLIADLVASQKAAIAAGVSNTNAASNANLMLGSLGKGDLAKQVENQILGITQAQALKDTINKYTSSDSGKKFAQDVNANGPANQYVPPKYSMIVGDPANSVGGSAYDATFKKSMGSYDGSNGAGWGTTLAASQTSDIKTFQQQMAGFKGTMFDTIGGFQTIIAGMASSGDANFETMARQLKNLGVTGLTTTQGVTALRLQLATAAAVADTSAAGAKAHAEALELEASASYKAAQKAGTLGKFLSDAANGKYKDLLGASSVTSSSGSILGASDSSSAAAAAAGTFTGTTAQKGMEKLLQANLDQQNSQAKIIKDQLTAQTKISQQMKAQMQYQQQITGLQNDMKTAMISGNYLQAASLKQQVSAAKVDFNATSVQQQLQDQADAMQANADQINQALSDLKDAIANNSHDISPSISSASKLGTLRATTVNSGIANGAPTVTTIINVNGTADQKALDAVSAAAHAGYSKAAGTNVRTSSTTIKTGNHPAKKK